MTFFVAGVIFILTPDSHRICGHEQKMASPPLAMFSSFHSGPDRIVYERYVARFSTTRRELE